MHEVLGSIPHTTERWKGDMVRSLEKELSRVAPEELNLNMVGLQCSVSISY